MKRNLAFLAVTFLLVSASVSAQSVAATDAIIRKVADKLAAVRMLGYKYTFEFSYPTQGRSMKQDLNAFLDLRPADRALRFRFQFSGDDRFAAYNGTEKFILDKAKKKIYVESKPAFDSFGDTFLMNSPLVLKYALPKVLADKTIQKKVTKIRSDGREHYVIELSMFKKIFTAEGGIVAIRPDNTNKYRITVDKATLLPTEVVQSNDKNDETVTTTYAELTEKPTDPVADTWFFSTYLNEYALQRKDKLVPIEAGKTAPVFTLVKFPAPQIGSLSEYAGKVVLLEFWIAHCGFCIAAVPRLNDISHRYRDKGLEVVSVNMYDPAGTIELFKEKNKPEYTIFTGGDQIATHYGIDAYPAFVLVGVDGKVVYSASGLQEKELEAAITAAIDR